MERHKTGRRRGILPETSCSGIRWGRGEEFFLIPHGVAYDGEEERNSSCDLMVQHKTKKRKGILPVTSWSGIRWGGGGTFLPMTSWSVLLSLTSGFKILMPSEQAKEQDHIAH